MRNQIEDFTIINPSSPSAGPPPSVQQRNRSRGADRPRSRDRVRPRSFSHAGQQQPVVPPPRIQQNRATQGEDEDSATVDPQNNVIDHSRSPQDQEDSRRQGPQKHKEKKTIAEKQPSTSPKAKKHKPMDSDEDDEEPLNEPGTSSHSQLTVPVLPLHQGPAASSPGPAAIAISGDEDSEYSDEYSAESQDSGRTVLYPDLNVLTNCDHWAMTTETTLQYAAAAGSFCFVTTENGDQKDMCNSTTLPCVQR